MTKKIALWLAAMIVLAQAQVPIFAANSAPLLANMPLNDLPAGSLGENVESGAYALLYLALAYAALSPKESASYIFLLFDLWRANIKQLEIFYSYVLFVRDKGIIAPVPDLTLVRRQLDNSIEKMNLAENWYLENMREPPIEENSLADICALIREALALSSSVEDFLTIYVTEFRDIVSDLYHSVRKTISTLRQNVLELENTGRAVSNYLIVIENAESSLDSVVSRYVENISKGIQKTDNLPEIYLAVSAVMSSLAPVIESVMGDMREAVIVTPGILIVLGGGIDQDVYVGQTVTLKSVWAAVNPFTTDLRDVPITIEAPLNAKITVDGKDVVTTVDTSGQKTKYSFVIDIMPPGTSYITVKYENVLAVVTSESNWSQRGGATIGVPVLFEKTFTISKDPNIAPFAESSTWRFVLPITELPSDTAENLSISAKMGEKTLTVQNSRVYFEMAENTVQIAVVVSDLPPSMVFDEVHIVNSTLSFKATVKNWSSSKYDNIVISTPLQHIDNTTVENGTKWNDGGLLSILINSLPAKSKVTMHVTCNIEDMSNFAATIVEKTRQKYDAVKQLMKDIGMFEQYIASLDRISKNLNTCKENLITNEKYSLAITHSMYLFEKLSLYESLVRYVTISGIEVMFSGWSLAEAPVIDRLINIKGNVNIRNRRNTIADFTLRMLVPSYIENIKIITQENLTTSFQTNEIVYTISAAPDIIIALDLNANVVLGKSVRSQFMQTTQYISVQPYIQVGGQFIVEYVPFVKGLSYIKLIKELPSSTLDPNSVSVYSGDESLAYTFTTRLTVKYHAMQNPETIYVSYQDIGPKHSVYSADMGQDFKITVKGNVANDSDTAYENILIHLNLPSGRANSFKVAPSDKFSIYSPSNTENGVPVLLVNKLDNGVNYDYTLEYLTDSNGIINYLVSTADRLERVKNYLEQVPRAVYDNVSENLQNAQQSLNDAVIAVHYMNFDYAFRKLVETNSILDYIELQVASLLRLYAYGEPIQDPAYRILNIYINPEGAGTVGPTESGIYYPGTLLLLGASSNKGYRFKDWSGGVTGTNNPIVFLMPNDNVSIYANFEPVSLHLPVVSVTSQPIDGGFVAGGGPYDVGEPVRLTALANKNYSFVGWSGDIVGKENPYYFLMPSDNVNVVAHFLKEGDPIQVKKLTITVNDESMGSTNPPIGEYSYSMFENVNVIAYSNDGYEFVNWTDNLGNIISTSPNISFLIDSDRALQANFKPLPAGKKTLTILVNNETYGTTTPMSGTYSYDEGELVNITATPAQGCFFIGWSGDASGASHTLTVVMDRNKTITANFTQNPTLPKYSLTISVNDAAKGYTNPISGKYLFTQGEKISITAYANAGYAFESWSGDISETSLTVSLTMNKDISITANFGNIPVDNYVLTMCTNNDAGGKTIPVLGTSTYAAGTVVLIGATPNDGFVFIGWSGDIESNRQIESIIMDNNKRVTANFTETTYKLTASVTPSGAGTVNNSATFVGYYASGAPVCLEASANEGYEFTSWTVDNKSVSDMPLLLVMPSREVSVVANFRYIDETYNVNVFVHPQGAGMVSGDGAHRPNVEVRLYAIPNDGYVFDNWSGDIASNEMPYVFNMPRNDINVIANFRYENPIPLPTPPTEENEAATQKIQKSILENIAALRRKIVTYRAILKMFDITEDVTNALNTLLSAEMLLSSAEDYAIEERWEEAILLLHQASEKVSSVGEFIGTLIDGLIENIKKDIFPLLSVFKNIHDILLSESVLPTTAAELDRIITSIENLLAYAEKYKLEDPITVVSKLQSMRHILSGKTEWLRSELAAFIKYELDYIDNLKNIIKWAEATGAQIFTEKAELDDLYNALLVPPVADNDFLQWVIDKYNIFCDIRARIFEGVWKHASSILTSLDGIENALKDAKRGIEKNLSVLYTTQPHAVSVPTLDKFKEVWAMVRDHLPILYPKSKLLLDNIISSSIISNISFLLENIGRMKRLPTLNLFTNYFALKSELDNIVNSAAYVGNRLHNSLRGVMSKIKYWQSYSLANISEYADNEAVYSTLSKWLELSVKLLDDNEMFGALVYAIAPLRMVETGEIVMLPEEPPPTDIVYYVVGIVILFVVFLTTYVIKKRSKRRFKDTSAGETFATQQ